MWKFGGPRRRCRRFCPTAYGAVALSTQQPCSAPPPAPRPGFSLSTIGIHSPTPPRGACASMCRCPWPAPPHHGSAAAASRWVKLWMLTPRAVGTRASSWRSPKITRGTWCAWKVLKRGLSSHRRTWDSVESGQKGAGTHLFPACTFCRCLDDYIVCYLIFPALLFRLLCVVEWTFFTVSDVGIVSLSVLQ